MNGSSFLFDLSMSLLSGVTIDIKVAFSALLLLGIIIFGISILLKIFYRTGCDHDSEFLDSPTADSMEQPGHASDSRFHSVIGGDSDSDDLLF